MKRSIVPLIIILTIVTGIVSCKDEDAEKKFEVKGTIHLFDWHPSAGGDSWVFIDEIVVR